MTAFDPDAWAASALRGQGDVGLSDDDVSAVATTTSRIGALNAFDAGAPPTPLVVNSDKGLPSGTRAKQSFKGSKVGEWNFLRQQYGAQNVEPVYARPRITQDARGAYTQDPHEKREIVNFKVRLDDGTVTLADPEGFDRGDIADLAGSFVESAPGAVGTAAGALLGPVGAVVGGAAGDLAGSAVRQAVGAALPGKENLTLGDRAISAGVNVGAGLVAEVPGAQLGARLGRAMPAPSGAAARAAVDPLRGAANMAAAPFGTAEQITRKALSEPGLDVVGDEGAQQVIERPAREMLREGLELSERTGIPFTLGQAARNPTSVAIESAQRQGPLSSRRWLKTDIESAVAMTNFARKSAKAMLGQGVEFLGKEGVGLHVGRVYTSTMDKLEAKASAAFATPFNEAIVATKNAPVLQASNYLAEMDELIAKASSPHPSSAARKLVEQLKEWRAGTLPGKAGHAHGAKSGTTMTLDLDPENWGANAYPGLAPKTPKAWLLRVSEIQNMLADLGKRARSGEGLIEGVPRDEQAAIAFRLKSALERDLDAAIDGGGIPSHSAAKLREARDAYAESRRFIATQQNDLLQEAVWLEKSPEKVIDKFVSGYSDTQARKAMNLLAEHDPATARQVRRAAVEGVLDAAEQASGRGELAAYGVSATPANMSGQLNKTMGRLRVLVEGDKEAQAALDDLHASARRLAMRSGINGGSQTEPLRMWNASLAARFVRPLNSAQEWLGNIGSREFAEIANNPQALKMYAGIVGRENLTAREAAATAAQIAALVQRDRLLFGDAPAPENDKQQPRPRTQAPLRADAGASYGQ